MAFLTRKEYAELCGCDVMKVNTYVSRKKIVVLPNKLIDTENPVNLFFQKGEKKLTNEKTEARRAEKREAKKPKNETKSVEVLVGTGVKARKIEDEELDKAVVQLFTTPKTKEERELEIQQKKQEIEEKDYALRKEKADTEKAEHQAELARIQVEKQMGKLIPVDLVDKILSVNIHHIYRTFESDMNNIASIYCDILAGGDRGKLSEIISRLRFRLEEIIKQTKITAGQEIENVISDFAEVRSRGERK